MFSLGAFLIDYEQSGYDRRVTQPRPRVPPSGQIATDLRAKIEAGEYSPDVALPSIVKLAEQYGALW